jgi:hypothetical protein
MELALFTPGAYIWPVLRNFEVFVASLGSAATGAETIAGSPVYPAVPRFVPDLLGRSSTLDARLQLLHRDLYTALLRPSRFFAGSNEPVSAQFWPDLVSTSAADLLDCFVFYFLGRGADEASVSDGMAVLRTVFFSHESTEPHLWLHYARERLNSLRSDLPVHTANSNLPAATRIDRLAFCATADRYAGPMGAGRVWGSVQRRGDGGLQAQLQCYIDPETAVQGGADRAAAGLDQQLRATLDSVLGTTEAAAA